MLALAASFVPSRAVAEEVVQDTWLAALRGLDAFEGRSSLKTWLFRILVNRARSTGSREQRSIPVADPEPAVDPSRFGGDGGWADPPEHWIEAAERRMEAGKLAGRIRAWIDDLPARQREVVLLRDVEGMSSEEVCAVLALTEGNQRVLLHRGRAGSGSCSRTSSGRCDEAPAPARTISSAGRPSSWSPTTSRARWRRGPGAGSRRTWPAARTAPSTWPRCARRSAWPAGSSPRT